MIDVSKLTKEERWKLGFVIAAAGNLEGEDNATNEYFYSGVFGHETKVDEPVVPSHQEIKEEFKKFFGFDYEDIWKLNTLNPFGN